MSIGWHIDIVCLERLHPGASEGKYAYVATKEDVSYNGIASRLLSGVSGARVIDLRDRDHKSALPSGMEDADV